MTVEACDVAIVGAGPSGIGAAALLAGHGLKVVLIDENNQIGGQIWRKPAYAPTRRYRGLQLYGKAAAFNRGFQVNRNLHILTPARVLGVFPGKHLLLSTPEERAKEIKTRRIIFATGARESVRPFKGWTLPGVMTLGAVQILLKHYGVLAASPILTAGAGPLLYLLSGQIMSAGGSVTAVLDRTSLASSLNGSWALAGQLPKIAQGVPALLRLALNRVPVKRGMQIVEVRPKCRRLEVFAAKITSSGALVPGTERRYETQMVACGNGFVPSIELPQLAGCRLTYAAELGGRVVDVKASMETSVPGVFAIGEITGIAGGDKAHIDGRLAALSILRQFGKLSPEKHRRERAALWSKRRRCIRFAAYLNRQWAIHRQEWFGIDDATTICRCEDITMGVIRGWIDKGISSAPELKRAARSGMGNCQGRTCGPLIYDILDAYGVAAKQYQPPLSVRTPVKPIPLRDLVQLNSCESSHRQTAP
jgi:NADPH-dependent 2,4-dienoyl-CoA reductase/sulfur reductase-like enzyme